MVFSRAAQSQSKTGASKGKAPAAYTEM